MILGIETHNIQHPILRAAAMNENPIISFGHTPESLISSVLEALEAQLESSEMENGRVSYKQVVERASNRALIEHPNVYRDSYPWKVKIVALLDQDGDEPGQLCNRKSFELND